MMGREIIIRRPTYFSLHTFTIIKECAKHLQILSSPPVYPHIVNIIKIYPQSALSAHPFFPNQHIYNSPMISIYHLALASSNAIQNKTAVWSTALGFKDKVTSSIANLDRAVGAWGAFLQMTGESAISYSRVFPRANESLFPLLEEYRICPNT
jgi:hypothetical protein